MNNLARDLEWMAPFTLLQARDLQMSVETLGGCSTGEARITGGHNLEAKHIIHIVGPIWEDGHENEPQLLEIATKTPSASPQKMAFALLHSLQSVLGLTTSHRIRHP